MKRLLARLDALPIRWRLAVTSAALTAAILIVFAVVCGVLVTRQLQNSFNDDLRDTAATLGERLGPTLRGELRPDVLERVVAGDAAIRIVGAEGRVFRQTPNAPDLGPPSEEVRDVGGFRVASRPIAGPAGEVLGFIQYAEPTDDLDANVARVRLFLILGVLGGTALALLAGLAVASRAMAPIAALTGAAKDVARTRDPAVRLPKPAADDEVADLARTLEQMLMALDQARGETEAALERQREFVADASHELRTPLTSVLANLELLEEALAGEDLEIASSALRSSRRMRRLVADLLLLARADAGRRAPHRATDLGEVARAAAAEVAPLADGHEVEVDSEDGVQVEAVPDDLHRLVLNLVENAVHHTPPGTRVQVRVRREHGMAALVVEDDGPGIPPELRKRVFDRFVRGPGDAGAGGSGLGLAIVRAVAESHGGGVVLEEASGGTRFTVRLPAIPAGFEPSQRPAPAPRRAGAS